MDLIWNDRVAKGDLGKFEILQIKGKWVSYWTPFNEKGYRAFSNSYDTIEEAQKTSQIMEDDMTGISLITNERWQQFLENVDDYTRRVYS